MPKRKGYAPADWYEQEPFCSRFCAESHWRQEAGLPAEPPPSAKNTYCHDCRKRKPCTAYDGELAGETVYYCKNCDPGR